MRSWCQPDLPSLPGVAPVATITDSRGRQVRVLNDEATLYVCGITPYDATHLGHAFTYVIFDVLVRTWIDGGLSVTYAQNITDIDEPLFERAERDGVNYRDLAAEQIDLFRSDMTALRVIPPTRWVAVSEILAELEDTVRTLEDLGKTYRLSNGDREDIYSRVHVEALTGEHLADLDLEAAFIENGGDPDRPGKCHRLDPLLWKGVKGNDYRLDGEKPGAWRPGWHIECAQIAADVLGPRIDIQGGGMDLIFPHHEMTGHHLADMGEVMVQGQMNTGIVAFRGQKMSKSVGNLVRVSRLLDRGTEAMAIRLVLLAHQWTEDWEFTAEDLEAADRRLTLWRRAHYRGGAEAEKLLEQVRLALANNLDTPTALALIDEWAATNGTNDDRSGAALFHDMCNALLGVTL